MQNGYKIIKQLKQVKRMQFLSANKGNRSEYFEVLSMK